MAPKLHKWRLFKVRAPVLVPEHNIKNSNDYEDFNKTVSNSSTFVTMGKMEEYSIISLKWLSIGNLEVLK